MKILKAFDEIKSAYDKTINLVDGLVFSQKNQIKTIEFYNNSKYLGGQKDDLGEKPFEMGVVE